jgi:hypothetical protein
MIYLISIPYIVNDKIFNYEPEIVTYEKIEYYNEYMGDLTKCSKMVFSKIYSFEYEEINGDFFKYEKKNINHIFSYALFGYDMKEMILRPNLFLKKFDKNSLIPFNDFDLAKLAKINLLKLYENKFDFIKEIIKKYERFEDEIVHKII